MSTYMVDNAGLVLLGSYLEEFLIRLELVNIHSQFVGEKQRIDGVRVITRLVHPDRPLREEDFILGKALCGVPQEVAVRERKTPNYGGNVDFQYERLNFFRSFLDHWVPDNVITTEVFLETFLHRPGVLDMNQFSIEVDPSLDDVLLHKLPTVLDSVSLPWLQKPLKVVWYY